MTEKLRIYRPFGNGTTVYGNVLPVLSPAVLVDYLREALLTHTTLSGNQHRQIGRSHLNGNIDGTHQCLVIADDAKT